MSTAITSKTLLYIVNNPAFFVSHRLSLASAAASEGYRIIVGAPLGGDLSAIEQIKAHGFEFHAVSLSRRGMNPFQEILSIFELYRLFQKVRPSIIHLLTIKPVVYGGIAARSTKSARVVATITGMGFVYTSNRPLIRTLRHFVNQLYRVSLGSPRVQVIFQNSDDKSYFISQKIIAPSRCHLILGSGVDLLKFQAKSPPNSSPRVLLAARMLWDKGIKEFYDAARLVQAKRPEVEFVLAGPVDEGNPSAISRQQLEEWDREGIIKWIGPRRDMPNIISSSTVVCLPSYREGMPLVLLEAMACERPVVGADAPGMKDLIRHRENGLLVPARQSEPLAQAILELLGNPDLRRELTKAAHRDVTLNYSKEAINSATIQVYSKALN